MFRILAHSYPNNEVRATLSALPSHKPFRYDDDDSAPGSGLPVAKNPNSVFDVTPPIALDHPPDDSGRPLYLSLVPNSKPERNSAGYGLLPTKPTQFGVNAKRQLVRSGAALESEAPPHECLFLTGTLPGSTVDAFTAIAAYSGYIVNSLKAWIAKSTPQKLDFYCWEYQRRGALHLHYCCHIPNDADRLHIINEFRGWWISCLSRVGDRSNCDLFRKNSEWTWLSDLSKVRAVAEVCRKSPARYLAKYLSKSSTPTRGVARAFTPSRWWGTSRPLKKLLDSLTKTCEIIVSGYHAAISKMENVTAICDSSDGVTYKYPHTYGMGKTIVNYPSSKDENENLWYSLQAQSIMRQIDSSVQYVPPSESLKVMKIRLMDWSKHWSENLTDSHQGLKESLMEYWNMTSLIIPSQSTEPLNLLMFWAARTSDIRSLSRYTPALGRSDERMINQLLDLIEVCMKDVCDNGWR